MALWEIEEKVKHFFADELEKDLEMTGAQFIVKFLEQKGVTQIYGIPGAAILPFYDAVLEQEHIRSINVRHEQTAIFMAEGYARSTGKVGICAATSGPGATNFLTGLFSAYGDSVPLIALTGQVPTNQIGKDAQEVPIVEMARPVTKAAYLVTKTNDLPKVMNEAWKLATKGRRGPVLIDIPVNVQKGLLKVNLEDYMGEENHEQDDSLQVTESQLEQVFRMIEEAKSPVLMVGESIALEGAFEALKDLAQVLQIPVVSLVLGKEGFPNYHRLYAGMVGTLCQTPLGNKTILESDLILNLGGRFDRWSTEEMSAINKDRKVIYINNDGWESSHHVPINLAIASDVKCFIQKLSDFILSRDYKPKTEALERIQSLQKERTRLSCQSNFETSHPKSQLVIGEVRKGLRPDAIVTLDSGLSQIWAAQLFEAYEPRTFLITRRAGTMGWGVGAAMGAQLAYPQRQVINILEDASMSVSLQELATVAKHNIPVVVVVLNNSLIGLMRQQQNQISNRRGISTAIDYDNHIQGHQRGLDFVATARGMGVEAELIEKPGQITDALTRAFSAYRPYLIEILVDSVEQYSVLRDGKTVAGVRDVS